MQIKMYTVNGKHTIIFNLRFVQNRNNFDRRFNTRNRTVISFYHSRENMNKHQEKNLTHRKSIQQYAGTLVR